MGRPPGINPIASRRNAREYLLRSRRRDAASAQRLVDTAREVYVIRSSDPLGVYVSHESMEGLLRALDALQGALEGVPRELLKGSLLPTAPGSIRDEPDESQSLGALLDLTKNWLACLRPPLRPADEVLGYLAAGDRKVFLAGLLIHRGLEPTAAELVALEFLVNDRVKPSADPLERERRLDAWRKTLQRATAILRGGGKRRARRFRLLPPELFGDELSRQRWLGRMAWQSPFVPDGFGLELDEPSSGTQS
jgi:hypothetical protein